MDTILSALYVHIVWPLRSRLSDERGLEAVEYALIAALVSAVVLLAVTGLRNELATVINQVTSNLQAGQAPPP